MGLSIKEEEAMKMLMPNDFQPGQKVWFMGMKARVAEGMHQQWVEESNFRQFAVPIVIKGTGLVQLAHVDSLMLRGK